MTPEARIGFEIAIGAPSVFLILLRAWVLTRWKKNTFSNGITNAALYLTCLCVLATNGANIWSMSKIIQYRDRPNIVMESSTGLPMHLVGTGLKISFALKFFYIVSLYGVKAAFIGIFLELKKHLERWLQIALHIAIAITIVCFLLNFFLVILWCLPFETNWTLVPGQLCSSMRSTTVVTIGTASNIITDLAIMAIPFFILKTFPLRRREWYGIAFVFSLGLICIVASIVRYVFLYRFIAGDGHIRSLPSQQNVIVITSELEGVIAVWAACLPALRALITRRQSRVEGSAGRSRSHSEGAGGTLGSIVLSQAAANSASRRSKGYDASIAPNNGNIGLAVGFGYGAYDPSRDEELAVARGQGLISPVHNHTLDHPRGWQTDYKRASSNYEIEAVDSDREGSDVELRDSIGARTYGLKSPDRPVFRDLR